MPCIACFLAQLILLQTCVPTLSFSHFGSVQPNRHYKAFSLFAMPSKTDLQKNIRQAPDNDTRHSLGPVQDSKKWIPLNQTICIVDNPETIYSDIEENLYSQRLDYEILIERTNSVQKDIEIFEGNSATYDTQAISDQIEQSTDTSTPISAVWFARMLVLISAAFYGTNFTVVKILHNYIPTDVGAALRFALAAVVTAPWLFHSSQEDMAGREIELTEFNKNSSQSKFTLDRAWIKLKSMSFRNTAIFAGLEVGLFNGLGYLAQAEGLETVDASKSAFICSLAVVIVPVINFLSGKKILQREVLGAILAVVGVGFLELDGTTLAAGENAFHLGSGDLLSLVQPLTFGIGFWRMESAMRRFPHDAKKVTAAQLLATFVISTLYCFISSKNLDGLPEISQILSWISDPMILGALFWTGLITTGFTVYLEALALKTLSAAETTMLFSTEPLFGAVFAAAVMGETFGEGGLVGAALILGGCVFSNLECKSAPN